MYEQRQTKAEKEAELQWLLVRIVRIVYWCSSHYYIYFCVVVVHFVLIAAGCFLATRYAIVLQNDKCKDSPLLSIICTS